MVKPLSPVRVHLVRNQSRADQRDLTTTVRYVDADGRLRGPDGRIMAKPADREAVVQIETRQQRRLRARQAAKADLALVAARVWNEVTGGAGVVLVDGKEVKPAQ